MEKKILLTSFTTWLPHHTSNSSDDLLDKISNYPHTKFDVFTSPSLTFLRNLPVDVELASSYVITKINQIAPDAIICCGMAECREHLSIESNATCEDIVLKTNVDLEELVGGNERIEISHDAGKFVCEGLYHSVLKYLVERRLNTSCVFVHVPILTEKNLAYIVEDFVLLLQRIISQ